MSDALGLWKLAHILSATVLFGTGLGIAFFCWFCYRSAMRSGEIAVLRASLRWTVIADAWLTAPAVVFQAISGIVLMQMLGWPLVSRWSIAVWVLFIVTGACWLPVVAIQIALKREAERTSAVSALPDRFHGWFRCWFTLGVAAFTAVIAIFYLMVAKPLSISIN